jgi:hypothetical protein
MLSQLRNSIVTKWRAVAMGLLTLLLAGFIPQGVSAAPRSASIVPATTSCRPTTQLSYSPGIFSDVTAFINALDGNIVLQYTVNSHHQVRLGVNIPSCPNNYDGYYLRTDLSSNLCAINGPQYVLNTGQIQLEVFPCDPTKNIVVGFRFKYEENYNVTFQNNPRKLTAQTTIYSGTSVKKPTTVMVYDETP